MNQKTVQAKMAAALFAASVATASAFAAEPFVTWNGANGNPQIQTGLGNWTETFGYWFFYTDKNDGDGSNIAWPAMMDPPYYGTLDPVILECKGLCGTAVLKGGTAIEKPFVGFGFSIVGETSDTDPTLAAGDASAWNGLCVTYTSDTDLLLQLGPGPISNPNGLILDGVGPDAEPAQAISYPTATLPASKTGNVARVAWSDFKQIPSHSSAPIIDGETAAKQLSLILFKLQSEPGNYDFNICAVGPKDGSCPEKCGSSTTVTAKTFDTWNGADYVYQVQTGLGNETETNGIWYGYGDDNKGGDSKIKWPVEMCHEYETCTKYFFNGVIEHCLGFCGTARLDQRTSATKPFIGVGFNIVGETSTTNNTPAAGDASSWGGLCVTYTSDVDLQLELGLGDIVDSTISYANPAVTLPATKEASILPPKGKNGNKVVVSWSDFKMPSWYDGAIKIDGETAAKQLVSVRFKLQAEPGDYDFNICAVGPKDGICPEECGISSEETRIPIARGTTTAKAILNGSTLSFTGIKSAATAEVMNSLGQVVAREAIEGATSTLNLAHLDAGIYMVRVTGKSVKFTNKIVVR